MATRAVRALVFGGAGFIGSNFIRYLINRDRAVHILNYDFLTYSGNQDNLRDLEKNLRYRFVRANIGDAKKLAQIFKKFKPNYIINFAAETHVDKSIHVGSKEFIDTNITGVFNILEEIRKNPSVKKFVQVSTDEVYGSLSLGSRGNSFTEETPFASNVPYAATKAGGDMLCCAYFKTSNVPGVGTRCSHK